MKQIITFILLTLATFGEFNYPIEEGSPSLIDNTPINDELIAEEELVLNAIMGLETQQILEEESQNISTDTNAMLLPALEESLHTISQEIVQSATPYTPEIEYVQFNHAKEEAIKEHKYVMIKVEATGCRPCQTLDRLLATNAHIKSMIKQHIKAVKVNTDQENLPMGLQNMGTPTVFLIKPEENRVVMKLEGFEAIEDLEASLKTFVDEGYTEGLALR